MRIVFMGTPEFAVATLRQIVEDGWEVVAAYTQPDKPKNRGMKLIPTPVKEYAMSVGIPVYQPQSCRDEATLAQIRSLEPDVILVAAYGKLLPQALLDIPKVAILNVHSSLLPQYRGAAPINWAVLNGDAETGVTIQYMAAELDAGDILLTERTAITDDEDAGQLYDRLALLGGKAASGHFAACRTALPPGHLRCMVPSTSMPAFFPVRCPPLTGTKTPGPLSIRSGV